MYNPFHPFLPEMLEELIKRNEIYIVRQWYPRGVPLAEEVKGAFLFSSYYNKEEAQTHLDTIKQDKTRYLYDATNPQDYEKLKVATSNPEPYRTYIFTGHNDWVERAQRYFKEKVQRYIRFKLRWYPKKNDSVRFVIYNQFGELFVQLVFGSHEVKVRLEEVEDFK